MDKSKDAELLEPKKIQKVKLTPGKIQDAAREEIKIQSITNDPGSTPIQVKDMSSAYLAYTQVALQGLIASGKYKHSNAALTATHALMYADAMMKAVNAK